MKVLVLDGHASAAVAVVQSLGRAGAEVHVVAAGPCLAFASRYPARRIVCPLPTEHAGFLDWLRTLDAQERYGLVIPTGEQSLLALQGCDDADALRAKALLAPQASVETALDKTRTLALAERLGIPVPASDLIPRGADTPYDGPYPVVLKTVRSQVTRDGKLAYAAACIARSAVAREAYLEAWLPHSAIQQQRFFAGRGWGIECLYLHGEMQWCFAHERLHELPLTGGASTYRRSAACPPALLDATRRLLGALDWHGVAMAEFRVADDGRFVLLEINPRFWGSLPLAVGSGVDFPLGLLRVAEGGHPGPQPVYPPGYRMRNLPRDAAWMIENLRANRHDGLLLTRPPLAAAIEWGRVLLGREGWDHFSWRDPRPGLHEIGELAGKLWSKLANLAERPGERRSMRKLHARNLARLAQMPPGRKSLMFVCYGNICRSPLAEQLACARLPGWRISSSGLCATPGSRTPARIRKVAAGEGVSLEAHRASLTDKALVDAADIVLIMDALNYRLFCDRFPEARHKLLLLGMFGPEPSLTVPDPVEMEEPAAQASARLTVRAVEGLVRWLGA